MQDALDFDAAGEPLGDFEGGVFDGGEADGQRLEAAEGEAGIVGRDVAAEDLLGGADFLVEIFVADCYGAEEQVAVTADIFREGLHGYVDAMFEGVEEDAGGPGVVEDDFYVFRVGGGDDCGDVLDLHRDGLGAFGPNEARVFANQVGDSGADSRIVEGGGDAEAREDGRS